MTARYPRSSLALALVGALAACSSGEPGDAGPTSGAEGPDRELAWAPQEVYAIGGFDAPEWASFGSIESVGFDSEGNLYLLDGQTQQITHVSPTGEFVKTISGPGEGPGELAMPITMGVSPTDEIIVSDIGHRGFVRLGTDGEWIENATFDMSRAGILSEMAFLPDGSPIGSSGMRISMNDGSSSDDEEEEPEPEGRPIHRYALDGTDGENFYYAWEPPPPPEGGEGELSGSSEGGGSVMIRMQRIRAFTPQLRFAALPDGRVAVVDSTTYDVALVDPATGTEVGSIGRPIAPTPVTDRIRDLERERRIAEVEERDSGGIRVLGGGGGMSFDQEAMRNMFLDQIDNMVFYEEIPVIEDLAADAAGRLWIQRSSGVPGEDGPTDIMTGDGLRIPDAFGPGGLIAVIETDEFDVATVRVIRLPAG